MVHRDGSTRTWTHNSGWTNIGTPQTSYEMVYKIRTAAGQVDYQITNPDSPGGALIVMGSLDADPSNPWYAYAQMQHPGVQ